MYIKVRRSTVPSVVFGFLQMNCSSILICLFFDQDLIPFWTIKIQGKKECPLILETNYTFKHLAWEIKGTFLRIGKMHIHSYSTWWVLFEGMTYKLYSLIIITIVHFSVWNTFGLNTQYNPRLKGFGESLAVFICLSCHRNVW